VPALLYAERVQRRDDTPTCFLTRVAVPSYMVRATSRTGLARSSKGGLQYALRRLSRVRRGAADRTAAADGDKHSCQVTAYRHGGGPERLQCSRRAPQRAGEAEAGRVPEGRAAGGAQIWHRTCGSLRDKGWHLTRCGWPETCCSPQRRGRTSARGSQRARPTPRPLAQCSCRTTSSGFAARRPLFLCARGNEISFVALT
jgi:hypothetical protein